MHTTLITDDTRGRVGYVDVIMTFGTLVSIVVVLPIIAAATGMIESTADPLTGVLAQFIAPLLIIALLVSIGVSARS